MVLEIGEYKFIGYRSGSIRVYRRNAFIESFSVYEGIYDMGTLEREARTYLKYMELNKSIDINI